MLLGKKIHTCGQILVGYSVWSLPTHSFSLQQLLSPHCVQCTWVMHFHKVYTYLW